MTNSVISNRYEFMILVEAKDCNPNGDPDMGNLPRQDEETGLGYITDVAVKRRIRNYIDDAYGDQENCQILMQKGASINKKIAESVFKVNSIEKAPSSYKNQKVLETAKDMTETYWDVRTFGAVLSTGLNAGQVRGAVQIGISESVDPIHVEDITLSRMCYTDGKDFTTLADYEKEEKERPDDKKRTLGNKKFISYGLYVVRGSVSACLAEKNGFTENDLQMFFEALIQMYNHDISSSKEGMSVVSPLIVFKHVGTQADNNPEQQAKEARLGCVAAHKLYRLLDVSKKDDIEFPRHYEDYEVVLNTEDIPSGVEIGIKEDAFAPVIWGINSIRQCKHEGLSIK